MKYVDQKILNIESRKVMTSWALTFFFEVSRDSTRVSKNVKFATVIQVAATYRSAASIICHRHEINSPPILYNQHYHSKSSA